MEVVAQSFQCPNCGAPVTMNQTNCDFCLSEIRFSDFNSVASMPLPQVNKYARSYSQQLTAHPELECLHTSAAMCYLKLKLYDKALVYFEKAMESDFDNSETFFYAAVCLLKGQKAFLHQRPTINKILEYINAAIMIEPKGIYYYFLAYIKQDYFSRKYLTTSPNYREVLVTAKRAGYSEYDVKQLYTVLGVERPVGL